MLPVASEEGLTVGCSEGAQLGVQDDTDVVEDGVGSDDTNVEGGTVGRKLGVEVGLEGVNVGDSVGDAIIYTEDVPEQVFKPEQPCMSE